MDGVTRNPQDGSMPYGVDTIRLRISFPAAPVSQGYNGRAWKMRPLRGWTGGAEWDEEAAASANAQRGGSDTTEALRGQAAGGKLAQDVQFTPGRMQPLPVPSSPFIPGTPDNEYVVKSIEDLIKAATEALKATWDAVGTVLHAQKTDEPPKPGDPKRVSPSGEATTPTGPEDPDGNADPSNQGSSSEPTRRQQGAMTKVDNIINNGAKEHDFEGVVKELGGEDTGFDHVTEMRNNVRGLRDALGSIRGSLANPNLTPGVRSQLEAALERGQNVLNKMERALAGQR